MEQEKMKRIAEVLNADKDRAKELCEMSPADAAKAFTQLGCGEISEQEMLSLAEDLRKLASKINADGELDENALEGVSGGSVEGFLYGVFGGVVTVGIIAAVVPW